VQFAGGRRLWVVCAAVVAVAVLVPTVSRVDARYDSSDSLWANAMRSASGWQKPYDFAIFLTAGHDVLDGRDPYPDRQELARDVGSPYAYPPLLALLVVPLTALPEHAASTYVPGVLWTLLLLAATAGALALVGVRDWRCYPIALLAPVTLEPVEFGAIGPLLLLLLAVAWKYRDRTGAAGAAAGGAVVLKLFLWPVFVWLAVTRRLRAAVVGVAAALALALASWAAIGFDGLRGYPHLLDRLSQLEARNSYSAYAVARAVGLPGRAAQVLVVAAGLALLVLAWRAARDRRRSVVEQDRLSLTFALAAALVLTPILWLHYLVLLLLPIALARPRLSALWFVPLALTVFEALDWYRGWPRGDGKALASVAVLVAVVFVSSLRGRGTPGRDARAASAGA